MNLSLRQSKQWLHVLTDVDLLCRPHTWLEYFLFWSNCQTGGKLKRFNLYWRCVCQDLNNLGDYEWLCLTYMFDGLLRINICWHIPSWSAMTNNFCRWNITGELHRVESPDSFLCLLGKISHPRMLSAKCGSSESLQKNKLLCRCEKARRIIWAGGTPRLWAHIWQWSVVEILHICRLRVRSWNRPFFLLWLLFCLLLSSNFELWL